VGEVADEQHDESASARQFFSRTEAPIGVYNGEQAIIVYELRPLPPWPKYWIQALAKHGRAGRGSGDRNIFRPRLKSGLSKTSGGT